MSAGRGRLSQRLAAAGLTLAAVGLTAHALQVSDALPSLGLDGGSSTAAPSVAATVPEPRRARWVPGAPRRLAVPALGIEARVVPIKAMGSTLVPPADPQQLGWWADGARPGADVGSALVTGHTVQAGGGALDDLEKLQPGDRVSVRTDRGRVVYTVDRVRTYSKGAVADQAERLFSQEAAGRLVLITCEDWNGEVYLSNVVVTATPVAGAGRAAPRQGG